MNKEEYLDSLKEKKVSHVELRALEKLLYLEISNRKLNQFVISDIIDVFSNQEKVKTSLLDEFENMLTDSSVHYIIKLSVLDFFNLNCTTLSKKKIVSVLLSCLNMRNFKIVKNQIILTLFLYEQKYVLMYKSLFKSQLRRTKDYRSFIRIMNFIMEFKSVLKDSIDNDMKRYIVEVALENCPVLSVKERIKVFEGTCF